MRAASAAGRIASMPRSTVAAMPCSADSPCWINSRIRRSESRPLFLRSSSRMICANVTAVRSLAALVLEDLHFLAALHPARDLVEGHVAALARVVQLPIAVPLDEARHAFGLSQGLMWRKPEQPDDFQRACRAPSLDAARFVSRPLAGGLAAPGRQQPARHVGDDLPRGGAAGSAASRIGRPTTR